MLFTHARFGVGGMFLRCCLVDPRVRRMESEPYRLVLELAKETNRDRDRIRTYLLQLTCQQPRRLEMI